MTIATRLAPVGARAALFATLTLVAATAAAGVTLTGGTADVWPTWPGYLPGHPVPYTPYFYPSACFTYGACAAGWWEDRRQWRRPVAPSQLNPVEQDLWATTGSPWGYVRRLPPPTPASHIQPRYRDASTLRPEFADPDGIAPP